jgi:phosphate transport system permease protein
VLANDYSVGFSGPAIRWLNGILSGIPPIIYALMGSTLYIWFFWAKFGGKGLSAATVPPLPPPSTLPGDASCTLLGGMVVALLVIPFMTPLIDDALHGVPGSLKEASLALGAGRWHTLKSVSIPYAVPGIVNALLLGVLTALGEAIVVAYCIGFGARSLPSPIVDVLERTAPLTSTIASLAGGGFSRSSTVGPVGQSVASVMGLMLLALAFGMLGLSWYMQRRIRGRPAG